MQCKEAASKASNAGHFANTVTCLPCRSLNKHGNQYSEARNNHVYKCSTYSHFKCHSVSDFNKVERVMTVRELPLPFVDSCADRWPHSCAVPSHIYGMVEAQD